MRKQKKQTLVLLISIFTLGIFAQEREQDTLNPDVINVIKPYKPTISDAFKVKEVPSLDDEETAVKKEIKYNIFSFPVASTFTPAKGKAAVVDKAKKVKLFDNYATLGVGTYTTVVGEVYLNHELNSGENINAHIGHHSSGGGIDNVLLDDSFRDSKLDLSYSKRESDYDWSVLGGLQLQSFNWYGLPQPFFNQIAADAIGDVSHNFSNAYVSGDLNVNDSFFKSANVLFRRFGDNQGSGENRFIAKGVFDVPIQDELVSVVLNLDYLSGSFDSAFGTNTELNYGNFQLAVSPTYELTQDDLEVNLGATITYLNDVETGKNKLFIYPNVSASYRLLDDVVIAFGGIKGGLIQNSYYDFAQRNPFVSPTLLVSPTDKQLDSYVGLKGKLSNTLSYSIKGSYASEKNRPLFVNNGATVNEQPYTYENSFGIIYDDVTTLGLAGEIGIDINRNFTMTVKGAYYHYNTKFETEDWNLPDVTASVFMDYQISETWFTGANLFFAGERKDIIKRLNSNSSLPIGVSIASLESYFDVNTHVGYHVNDRWSVYVKANNLIGEEYTKWQNTPVQGRQFLAGATYKFDF